MALAPRHSADPRSPSSVSRSSLNPSAVVPMGIWLSAPTAEEYHDIPRLPDGISRRLVTRVVEEFSQPDGAIVITGSSPDAEHVAALAASCTDRRITSVPVTHGDRDGAVEDADSSARTQPLSDPRAGSADLVLALAVSTPTGATPTVFSRWARWLRPGSTLVVITANPAGPGRFANHAGTVISRAETVGLVYLQHVIAVLAHVEGDRLLVEGPRHGPLPPRRPRETVHVPVHRDVLIFVSPRA